jgi:hypothetical protein
LSDLCGVGRREAGKIVEASAPLLKVASFFLSVFFFFFAFSGGFAVVWRAGSVGKVPMFLQFSAPTAVAAVGATGKDFLNILEVC